MPPMDWVIITANQRGRDVVTEIFPDMYVEWQDVWVKEATAFRGAGQTCACSSREALLIQNPKRWSRPRWRERLALLRWREGARVVLRETTKCGELTLLPGPLGPNNVFAL